jgi:hypothetical protein
MSCSTRSRIAVCSESGRRPRTGRGAEEGAGVAGEVGLVRAMSGDPPGRLPAERVPALQSHLGIRTVELHGQAYAL